jgi:hypothetical protein
MDDITFDNSIPSLNLIYRWREEHARKCVTRNFCRGFALRSGTATAQKEGMFAKLINEIYFLNINLNKELYHKVHRQIYKHKSSVTSFYRPLESETHRFTLKIKDAVSIAIPFPNYKYVLSATFSIFLEKQN